MTPRYSSNPLYRDDDTVIGQLREFDIILSRTGSPHTFFGLNEYQYSSLHPGAYTACVPEDVKEFASALMALLS